MNKDYLKYLFKSKKGLVAFTLIAYLLIEITCYFSVSEERLIATLAGTGVVLGIVSYALVPIMFSYTHNKKAVDSYFALPIKRKEMLISTLTFIFLVAIVPFVILSLANLLITFVTNMPINIAAFLLFLLIAIIGSMAVVLFSASLFLEANTTFDGIVLICAYTLLPYILLLAFDCFQDFFVYGYDVTNILMTNMSYISLPYAIVVNVVKTCDLFNEVFVMPNLIKLVICILWHLVVSFMALERNFLERKTERAETISNRFFSYPFIIYAYVLSLVMITAFSTFADQLGKTLIPYALIFIAYIASEFVYKRKFSISIKNIIFYVLSIAISVSLGIVAYNTKGFGLSEKYNKNPENIYYSLNYYNYDNSDLSNKEIDELVNNYNNQHNGYEYFVEIVIKNKDIAKSKELIDLIESKRKDSIDCYYESKENIYLGTGSIAINNDFNENSSDSLIWRNAKDSYWYRLKESLTLDELKLINKYSKVEFQINGEINSDFITLDELLSKVN